MVFIEMRNVFIGGPSTSGAVLKYKYVHRSIYLVYGYKKKMHAKKPPHICALDVEECESSGSSCETRMTFQRLWVNTIKSINTIHIANRLRIFRTPLTTKMGWPNVATSICAKATIITIHHRYALIYFYQ